MFNYLSETSVQIDGTNYDLDPSQPKPAIQDPYAENGVKIPPYSDFYDNGRAPLDTLPAAWFNFFINSYTVNQVKARHAILNIYQELIAVLGAAGKSPIDSNITQLCESIQKLYDDKSDYIIENDVQNYKDDIDLEMTNARGGETTIAERIQILLEELEDEQAEIDKLIDLVDAVAGLGGYLTNHDFGVPNPYTPNDLLTDYALDQTGETDKNKILNGTKVVNTNNNHLWVLENNYPTQPSVYKWVDAGYFGVPEATDVEIGVVKLSNSNPLTSQTTANSGYTSTKTVSMRNHVHPINTTLMKVPGSSGTYAIQRKSSSTQSYTSAQTLIDNTINPYKSTINTEMTTARDGYDTLALRITALINNYNSLSGTISTLQTTVNTLASQGGYLNSYNFGKDTPTDAELNTEAKKQTGVASFSQLLKGTRIINSYNNNLFILATTGTNPTWSNLGYFGTPKATTGQLGVVYLASVKPPTSSANGDVGTATDCRAALHNHAHPINTTLLTPPTKVGTWGVKQTGSVWEYATPTEPPATDTVYGTVIMSSTVPPKSEDTTGFAGTPSDHIAANSDHKHGISDKVVQKPASSGGPWGLKNTSGTISWVTPTEPEATTTSYGLVKLSTTVPPMASGTGDPGDIAHGVALGNHAHIADSTILKGPSENGTWQLTRDSTGNTWKKVPVNYKMRLSPGSNYLYYAPANGTGFVMNTNAFGATLGSTNIAGYSYKSRRFMFIDSDQYLCISDYKFDLTKGTEKLSMSGKMNYDSEASLFILTSYLGECTVRIYSEVVNVTNPIAFYQIPIYSGSYGPAFADMYYDMVIVTGAPTFIMKYTDGVSTVPTSDTPYTQLNIQTFNAMRYGNNLYYSTYLINQDFMWKTRCPINMLKAEHPIPTRRFISTVVEDNLTWGYGVVTEGSDDVAFKCAAIDHFNDSDNYIIYTAAYNLSELAPSKAPPDIIAPLYVRRILYIDLVVPSGGTYSYFAKGESNNFFYLMYVASNGYSIKVVKIEKKSGDIISDRIYPLSAAITVNEVNYDYSICTDNVIPFTNKIGSTYGHMLDLRTGSLYISNSSDVLPLGKYVAACIQDESRNMEVCMFARVTTSQMRTRTIQNGSASEFFITGPAGVYIHAFFPFVKSTITSTPIKAISTNRGGTLLYYRIVTYTPYITYEEITDRYIDNITAATIIQASHYLNSRMYITNESLDRCATFMYTNNEESMAVVVADNTSSLGTTQYNIPFGIVSESSTRYKYALFLFCPNVDMSVKSLYFKSNSVGVTNIGELNISTGYDSYTYFQNVSPSGSPDTILYFTSITDLESSIIAAQRVTFMYNTATPRFKLSRYTPSIGYPCYMGYNETQFHYLDPFTTYIFETTNLPVYRIITLRKSYSIGETMLATSTTTGLSTYDVNAPTFNGYMYIPGVT